MVCLGFETVATSCEGANESTGLRELANVLSPSTVVDLKNPLRSLSMTANYESYSKIIKCL